MAKKEKKALVTEAPKKREHSIDELRQRKKFVGKVALIGLGVIAVALAVAIPWWFFVYKPQEV